MMMDDDECITMTHLLLLPPPPPPSSGISSIKNASPLGVSTALDLSKGVEYKDITIGVPKEIFPGERRVAQVPCK